MDNCHGYLKPNKFITSDIVCEEYVSFELIELSKDTVLPSQIIRYNQIKFNGQYLLNKHQGP